MPSILLRSHSSDPDAYSDHVAAWETVADGEEEGTERAKIRAARSSAEPRETVAGLYGFESWDQFEAQLRELAPDDPFIAAWRAIESGDRDALARAMEADASVVTARGDEGATLLDHAIWKTDQGDWSWPPGSSDVAEERLELVKLLLDAGADVEQGNLDAWAPLHSAAYIGWLPTIELLLARGARVDRSTKGDGGTPLILALFWGHREAAERLAREGLVPLNLRVAAGLGREDLLASVSGEGSVSDKGKAGEHRAFYRPHPGFKDWRPTDDPREIQGEALIWACRSGRARILGLINGNVNVEIGGTTPLLTAAGNGWIDCVGWLLDHGADIERTAAQWRGATALHAAAWFNHLEIVKLLVDRGAPCDLREPEHDSTPFGWALFHGNTEVGRWLAENARLDVSDAARAAELADQVKGPSS